MVIEAIMELVKKCHAYGKPAAIYTPNAAAKTISYRDNYKVPLFESPEEAVRALAVSHQHYRYVLAKEEASGKKYDLVQDQDSCLEYAEGA